MILAIIFAIVAIMLLCKLTLHLIIYALPLYVGATAGVWIYSTGTAPLASVVAAALTAIAALVIAHWLLAAAKSPVTHILVGIAFAAPAAFAAYHLVHGIVFRAMPSEAWTFAVSITAAAILGVTAWTSLPNLGRGRKDHA